ncbi:MAG: inositol oxygenase [Abitibacteriaceae bacterium]|nr:inositol oxygenase [Abditibacteriaceae bacterium]MBV9867708.1 inositol oxygenase [Abditibacteriaceae bacterium]
MSDLAAPNPTTNEARPLEDLEHWEEFLQQRYPQSARDSNAENSSTFKPQKAETTFRDYRAEARPSVKEFYRLNHTYQTFDFVQQKKREYLSLDKRKMGIWEAMEYLNTLVDDSDPDTDLSQIEHLLQAAEAIRQDVHPRWFILTGLIHDLGKILCLWGEPQWAVVGDTFPVGCAYSEKVVFPEFFALNPDAQTKKYQTPCGVYEAGCGLDNVHLSWGHDEYLYHVVKDYLPTEALYMIRYHSFYAAHKEGAYTQLMDDQDQQMFAAVRQFNPYDLYSKSEERPDVVALKPFYQELIAEYFPPVLQW